MGWRRVLGVFTLAGAVAFVALFELNLHCTQWTSFPIAFLDFEPHVEEAFSDPLPLVYRPGGAVPTRVAAAAVLFAFLFFPGCALITGRPRFFRTATLSVALYASVGIMAALPRIFGERLQAVAVASLLVMTPGYFAALLPRETGTVSPGASGPMRGDLAPRNEDLR